MQSGKQMYVFHKWISAISPLLVSDTFNEETWRTARPWLDFGTVRKCHYEYLAGSLGSVKCGPHIVTDKMIAKAVTYEKSITRIFDHSDAETIRDIIVSMYEPCPTGVTKRMDMMKRVNDELVSRGLNTVGQASIGWRNALHELGIHGAGTQFKEIKMKLREDCTEEFINVIRLYFEPSKEKIDEKEIKDTIRLYLTHQSRNMEDHELSVSRAIRTCTLYLKHRITTVVDLILKHYKPVHEYVANRKHIIDTINELRIPRTYDDPFWDVVFSRIEGADMLAPMTGVDYDTIIKNGFEYDSTCRTNSVRVKEYVIQIAGESFRQVMFSAAIRRICRHCNELLPLRKRRNIPWDQILHDHCKRGQSKHTVPYLNLVLKNMGFQPFHPEHSVWEYVREKGLQPRLDVLHLIRTCTRISNVKTPRDKILHHVNMTHQMDLKMDSLDWMYAMTHFADGPLPLKPN